jgi:pimeloyl-ACP methyl ester carboxylesterase
MDLRGYGGSDHTPHGYDPMTLAADVAGLIRALGEEQAIIVGQGWGGLLAWSVATMHPDVVAGIVPVSMPHPLELRKAILKDTAQRRAVSYVFSFQLPFFPEHQLRKDDAAKIGEILRDWSAGSWPDEETANVYRAAMLGHASPHCALEYHRWAFRSILRSDGRRFNNYMKRHITAPVLQIHGVEDGSITAKSAQLSNEHVVGNYEWIAMPGVGHFPQEEDANTFNEILLRWLKETL